MDVVSFFVTYTKTAEFEQPTKGPLDDTTMNAQPTAVFRVSLGDERLDAALAQWHTDFVFGVVGAISERREGPLAATTARTFDRWNRVDQRDRGSRIVDVRSGVRDSQRRPLAIAGNMPLRAIFTAIGGIGAGLRPPKSARTEQLSIATFDQSISSASPSSSSSTCQIFSHTPTACQSRKRRQQVMPDPQPSSWGKYSQGQPVRSTNKMPVSACRFDTRGRPPLGLARSGGNNGSIRSHNSSASSGLAIAVPP
jgi:hypothetical protein